MKYLVLILTLFLFFSCKNAKIKTDANVNCFEKIKEDAEYSDLIFIKTCAYKNYVFKSIGTPDYKGRYSYNYEVFKIDKSDTLKIKNSDFFNENVNELEKLINEKLKTEYDSNAANPEISDCMEWIDFREYTINEFGISFISENHMEFNIYYGIGGACFVVNSSSVILELTELEKYLK